MRPEGRPSGRSDPLSFQIWVFTISSAVRRHGRDRILVLSMSVPFLHSEQQHKRSAYEHGQTYPGLLGHLLVEEDHCEYDREQDAEFIYGYDQGCRSVLQGLVEAQPRRSRGQSGEDEESPVPPSDGPYVVLGLLHEYYRPGMMRTTAVRMAVPRLDSTPSMPTFPRMDVSAANTAERMA